MLDDAKKFWEALSGKVETACRQETRNAFRCGRYDVTTAPNGTTMGVTLPMGDTELFLPYSQEVASAQVGDAVLVVWWGSMSTARVCFFGDGYRGTSISGKTGSLTLNDIMAWDLSIGESIPSGSDLNDYTTPGSYYVSGSAIAGTLSNAPWTDRGFKLVVTQIIASNRLNQIATPNGDVATAYKIRYYNGTWSSWKQISFTTDATTPSALGSAAVGTANSVARADHVHPMPSASDVGALAIEGGTAIPNGANLNSYTTVGNFYCNTNTDAQSLTNVPSGMTRAFTLTVDVPVGVPNSNVVYRRQTLRPYDLAEVWQRMTKNGGTSWTEWSRDFGITASDVGAIPSEYIRMFTFTANQTRVFNLPSGSSHLLVAAGPGTAQNGLYILSVTNGGAVSKVPIQEAGSLTLTAGTNSLTIESSASVQIFATFIRLRGGVVTT